MAGSQAATQVRLLCRYNSVQLATWTELPEKVADLKDLASAVVKVSYRNKEADAYDKYWYDKEKEKDKVKYDEQKAAYDASKGENDPEYPAFSYPDFTPRAAFVDELRASPVSPPIAKYEQDKNYFVIFEDSQEQYKYMWSKENGCFWHTLYESSGTFPTNPFTGMAYMGVTRRGMYYDAILVFRVDSWYYLDGTPQLEQYYTSDIEVSLSTNKYSVDVKEASDADYVIPSCYMLHNDTKIKKDNIEKPVAEYIASTIKENYKDGKQVLRFTVKIDDEDDLFEVGEIVTVLDESIINVDLNDALSVNRHSIARTAAGVAKRFKITSAEFGYNGAYSQALRMIETKES
jgi:hypothetical protein